MIDRYQETGHLERVRTALWMAVSSRSDWSLGVLGTVSLAEGRTSSA